MPIRVALAVLAVLFVAACAETTSDADPSPPLERPDALGPADPGGGPFQGDAKADEALPDRIDHAPSMLPIRNQGNRLTCYSFATAAEIEAHAQTGEYVSVEEIYDRVWRGSPVTGFVTREQLDDTSVAPETAWRYTLPQPTTKPADLAEHDVWYIGNVISTGTSETRLKNYLAASPTNNIVVGFYWAPDYLDYKSGMLTVTSKTGDSLPWSGALYWSTHSNCGAHVVLIVGYETRIDSDGEPRTFFKFRNSWGTGFGEHGYGFVSSAYVDRMAQYGHMIVDD